MSTFDSTKSSLQDLLRDIRSGKIQLPDFQRGWVWDDDRIQDLLVSIARSFPVGAIMLLETGGEVKFQTRPVEGLEKTEEKKNFYPVLLKHISKLKKNKQINTREFENKLMKCLPEKYNYSKLIETSSRSLERSSNKSISPVRSSDKSPLRSPSRSSLNVIQKQKNFFSRFRFF